MTENNKVPYQLLTICNIFTKKITQVLINYVTEPLDKSMSQHQQYLYIIRMMMIADDADDADADADADDDKNN